MGKYLKILVLALLCLSLLAVVGCKKEDPAVATTTGTVTEPQETTEGTVPEETTEKPVNIVEDPLNNGEGDPTDAMGTTDTTDDGKPNIDIEVDEDDSDTGNNGNTGNGNTGNGNTGNGNTGGNSDNTNTGDTDNGKDEDDFVIDFDDLT